jgi:hypothetical protein
MSDFQQQAQHIVGVNIVLPLLYCIIIGAILIKEILWTVSYVKYLMRAASGARHQSPSPVRKKKKKKKKTSDSDSE